MYWKIWCDALYRVKQNNPEDYLWMVIVFISMGNALNILGLLILLNLIWDTPILLFQNIQFIEVRPLDSLFKFSLQFLMVPVVFNFCYLKKRQRQEQRFLIEESPHKGRVFASYMLFSIIGLITSIIIAYLFK